MRFQPFIYKTIYFIGAVVPLVHATPALSNVLTRRSYHTFHSEVQDGTSLRYVANSGVCETTQNVAQYSGYIDVGTNMSMWFWFFEARNSPDTAPFTLWLNGGPGCSSMIGLFQENGPCQVTEGGMSTYNNPYSWNSVSNMIYIDQPIGTGFSYGTDTADSTETAAPFVWTAFQMFFESQLFSKYASRELVFTTESYGGHYVPEFVTYFDKQNAFIASGAVTGEPLVVNAIMINNGWFDPMIQYISYYTFVSDAPGYGQVQSNDALQNLSVALWGSNGCVTQEQNCYNAGDSAESNEICREADTYCGDNVYQVAVGNLDPNDLRQTSPASFPSESYVDFLHRTDIMNQIGAEATYHECAEAPYDLFATTGDGARTWLPKLSQLVNSGLRVLIWAGDADINCNWLGGYNSVLAMDWYGNETLHNTPLTNITLNGTPIAAVATVDNFTFARVYGAGHEVPAFQPAAALEIFTQVINGESLHSA